MMIDCGGSMNWASKMLRYYNITKDKKPNPWGFALDKLVISHPHGDHLADIVAVHDEIGFKWLVGGYADYIDDIQIDNIDFRKRNQDAVDKFIDVVKRYTDEYKRDQDRVASANPPCIVERKRFLPFTKGMDLNELSWFVSFEIGSHKVLFTGDMTKSGITKILESGRADEFTQFVRGTTILKVPHHGRENGCSEELFEAFGSQPLLCIASDKVLDEENEGTSNISWYSERTSDEKIEIDGAYQNRNVLTTRKDGDVFVSISAEGQIKVVTNNFSELRRKLL